MTRTATATKNELAPIDARPQRPHKGLTETQEELAELAADMLLNGGVRAPIDLLYSRR